MVEEIDRIMTGDGDVIARIGAAIREYKEHNGPLAEIEAVSGVSGAVISHLKRGVRHGLTVYNAEKIARALGYRLTFERME